MLHALTCEGTFRSQLLDTHASAIQCPTLYAMVRLKCCKHWRSGGYVSGRPHGSLGAVLRSTVRTTFKHLHDSNPLQSVYSQAGETNAHYVTAADLLEYLPPRDGLTCISIDSGPPGRPLIMNAISYTVVLKEMLARQPTIYVTMWNSAFTVWKHRWTVYCLCTAGDMCRNSFIKKEDETCGEEQHNCDHGHDNHDHDEQDEEEDD